MILFTLFALFFALSVLWRSARRAVVACTVAIFWLISAGWLTVPLLDLAQPEIYRTPYESENVRPSTFGARTVIIVPGSGTTRSTDGPLVPQHDAFARLSTAASLYRRCRASGALCRVILSGGNPQHHAASEADTYAPYLARAGVPPADIVIENRSLTTWQNARNVARILDHEHDDSLMLVTSAYQMRRALLDFGRFGYAPMPIVSNVRRARVGLLPRRSNLAAAETALHELIGTAQFYLYRMIGWF
ncbi:hypothetical protein CY652_01715 [Burkholderia sp. WAC0059]|uniref:YdcF family protein n=1 Tax=Burkholderia sp. WAC0059 TaxID=2066022 RepID=UPI000C7F065B|nr:YdcF family protein [Burkholderia sp. WAC0059]PLZ04404.1 hypothetical protein CY652_01715 [Burkholderia sp. WAC0059]